MSLTTDQKMALKNFVESDQELNALPHTSDGAFAIAAALQVAASPEFIVWRTSVNIDEIQQNGFTWNKVDNLTVGKARIWEWMFQNETRSFNPSKPNVREGIDACWVGDAGFLTVRASVYGHCKRSANRLEQLFATGSGTDVSPATMAENVEGSISYTEVASAMGWNV